MLVEKKCQEKWITLFNSPF